MTAFCPVGTAALGAAVLMFQEDLFLQAALDTRASCVKRIDLCGATLGAEDNPGVRIFSF